MELYRVSEVAEILDIRANTVRKWVKANVLLPVKLPGSRYNRFTTEEIDRLRTQMGLPDGDTMRLYRVGQVAEILDVHPHTIPKWVREDLLGAIKLPGSNYNRFTPQELNRLRQDMSLPPLDEQA